MTTTTLNSAYIPPEKQKSYFGHPAGLFVLFFTEMWERFSYYGMRALLMLYMTSYLIKDPAKTASVFGFDTLRSIIEMGFGPLETQPLSSQIYGLYTGFVYLSPFFGGILADKVWGQKKSVYIGAALMAIGHFLMAMENMFLLALFFLILGNGAFKPNISSQVGNLYPQGDARRDGAFTIFYMGINLGAFFSPLVCGTLGQKVGWHYGFGAAGIGMLVGLAVYHFGRHLLPLDKHEQLKAEG
jgi:POT family proton-dependent oligopeptide transporter